eukprot:919493-Prorocentrum_lima.AAC.1
MMRLAIDLAYRLTALDAEAWIGWEEFAKHKREFQGFQPGYNWQWWEQLFLWFRDNYKDHAGIMALLDSFQD